VFERQRLDSEAVLRAAAENGARALGMEGRLGSLEPGRLADLLIVDRDRIMFPPGRYDAEPFLDVVLDRTESADIDTVMAHGRVLMAGGRVTVVDEDALKERFAEAVQRRIYRLPEHAARWAELGRLVEPYVLEFYQHWYDTPVEPATLYNARRPPL
jgi:5-methylthioadenosine/S-adenosylhomocysteine deaminase